MESYLFQLTNFNNVPSSQIQRIFDEVSSLEDPMSFTNMLPLFSKFADVGESF